MNNTLRRKARNSFKVRVNSIASGIPRLVIRFTGKHIHCTVIQDTAFKPSKVLCSATTLGKNYKGYNKDGAAMMGKEIADVCKQFNIERVIPDRGGIVYIANSRYDIFLKALEEHGVDFKNRRKE